VLRASLKGGGQLLYIVTGEILDRDARGAREPERVNQALDAALANPVIDGLAGHSADGSHCTWATRKSDCGGHEIGPGYLSPFHARFLVAVSFLDDINLYHDLFNL